MELFVKIEGTPKPLPRPRFAGGRVISMTKKGTLAYRRGCEFTIGQAVVAARRAGEWPDKARGGAYSVEIEFAFPATREQRGGEWMTKRPDIDNLAKMILDAAQVAGVFFDDGELAELILRKRRVSGGGYAAVTFKTLGVVEVSAKRDSAPIWLTGCAVDDGTELS